MYVHKMETFVVREFKNWNH